MGFNQQLENLLKTCDKFIDSESGNLLKQNIRHSAEQFDDELIALLFKNQATKSHFFKAVGKTTVFNYRKFVDYIDDKNFLLDSYTKFSNKVGLTISNKHIKAVDKVALDFPFKDCILEGGQSKDCEKRKEIFFNEVLAKDEINRLLDKKVITNATKYTQKSISNKVRFNRDENGIIKDNLIIKGNNLLALHSLKSNFAGKVKLIYIDPPYNTGNDSFNYNDNFNHSTWLVFMKNRLEVAKDLLSDDGVIFVQCDDNEQAYLKVLMDEVFGKDKFLSTVYIQVRYEGKTLVEDMDFQKLIESIHMYKKGVSAKLNKDTEQYNYDKFVWDIQEIGDHTTLEMSGKKVEIFKKGNYKIIKKKSNKDLLKEIWASGKILDGNSSGRFFRDNIVGRDVDGLETLYKVYGIGDDKFNFRYFTGPKKASATKGKYYQGVPLNKLDKSNTIKFLPISNFYNFSGSFGNCRNEGEVNFRSGKKPEKLIQRIIELATKKGDIVLDYHLGSGTTCAVAHKMERQYIGIEQMDYIEDIAVKRMQKVIGKTIKKDGELLESVDFDTGGISKSVDWQGGGEFIYFELDKYNQTYIDKLNAIKSGHASSKTIEQLYDEIAKHAFLNYDVQSNKLLANKADFEALSLNKQLEFLFSILNKNQLYKNLSEIDDKDLSVDDKTKALNKGFYKE